MFLNLSNATLPREFESKLASETIQPSHTTERQQIYLLGRAAHHEQLAIEAQIGPNVHNSEVERHLYLAQQYRDAANA